MGQTESISGSSSCRERQNMNERELHARFRELGFELPHASVKRWSRQGLLPRPTVAASRGTGGGRGRAADWPEATVEQAAAIYAIRNQDYPGQKKRISPKTITAIRDFANTFLTWLEEYRDNTDDPLLGDFQNRFFTDIDVQVPSHYVKDADVTNNKEKVPTWRPALFSEAYEALAVKWIVTVEKVALGIPLTTPVTIRYYFGRLQPNRQNPEENARIPLCYLISAAMRSKVDRVHVIARSSELEKLPQVAKEDAFLGAKIKDQGWIRVSDERVGGDLASQLSGWISSSIGRPRTEVGET